jgi:hypothetical protein
LVQRACFRLAPIFKKEIAMRLILEAVVKGVLASSGLELAVSVALLALYMWLTAVQPRALIAIQKR